MSFLRFLSRCLLASFFVADGLKAAIDPAPLVEDAEPLAKAVTDMNERFLPHWIAGKMPKKTETFVRLHGSVEALGGVMLGTGIFRRTGAALAAAAYLPKLISTRPSLFDFTQLDFLRDVALLGGAMVAAGDTGGKPSYAWLASHKRWAAAEAKAASKAAVKAAAKKQKQTQALGEVLSSAGE